MRTIIQRVSMASCTVDNKITGQIKKGFMVLVGFTQTDGFLEIQKMAKKIVDLRIFTDENDKMNLNINQINGSILSISQFTLYANTEKGNRPSFVEAMEPEKAKKLYLLFNEELRKYNLIVEEGIFGADMKIALINDGPVTIKLEF